MSKKLIIDCDPGVDDALALILALHSLELKVEAITGVHGNVPLNLAMDNIRKVLSLTKPAYRPLVAQGAERPLSGNSVYAYDVHGEDGLGGAKIDIIEGESWGQFFPKPAEELILEMAAKFQEELILAAIGPLTNLALAIKKDLTTLKKIRKIIIMGGAVREKGNVTPYAEFNFYVDPLAAKIVMESGLPITLIPLDATHQVYLSPDEMGKKGKEVQDPFSKFLVEATGYDFEKRIFRGRRRQFYLHDPLAIAVAVQKQLVEKEKMCLSVRTEEGLYYGQVSELPATKAAFASPIEVALKVDSENFLKFFWERLGS